MISVHPGLAAWPLLRPAVLALVCGLMTAAVSAEPVHYRTELSRVDDPQLQAALEATSNLLALERAKEPPSAAGLVRRATQDCECIWTALRSFGCYAGDVRITISGLPVDTDHLIERIEVISDGQPVAVAMLVELGPLFTIGSFEVVDAATAQTSARVAIDRSTLGLAVGNPVRASAVISAQGSVVEQMRGQGYPFAAVPDQRIIVDHATRQMEITWSVEPGPYARFGPVAVIGLEEMDEGFVRGRFDHISGRSFSPDAVRLLRDNLLHRRSGHLS